MANLLDTYVVLDTANAASEVAVTPTIWQDLDKHFNGFKGRTLVSRFEFDKDWDSWERHPHGDEVVVLVSGAGDLVLEEGGRERVVRLSKPGDFVVVPKGTWHTARVAVPTAMIFITPGEGTENRSAE
jgi:mannose-6-phosphate isomerase-like protein (cupin superfamily)